MKKVTETIANAFAQGSKKSLGNTATDGNAFYLHGNKIAEWRENGLYMTLAGWCTVTTRERLNGIAEVLGLKVGFTQKAFEPYLNGKLIGANAWHNVSQIHLDAVEAEKAFDASTLGQFVASL
jgi:hypothetical protein